MNIKTWVSYRTSNPFLTKLPTTYKILTSSLAKKEPSSTRVLYGHLSSVGSAQRARKERAHQRAISAQESAQARARKELARLSAQAPPAEVEEPYSLSYRYSCWVLYGHLSSVSSAQGARTSTQPARRRRADTSAQDQESAQAPARNERGRERVPARNERAPARKESWSTRTSARRACRRAGHAERADTSAQSARWARRTGERA